MSWKDIASTISKSAPLLGAALAPATGGASIAVGGIISMVGSLFGLSPEETTPDRVSQIITQDPQAIIKLKELEFKHKEVLEGIILEKEKLIYQDISGARQREIAVVQATGKKDINLYVLAWLVVAGFFGLTATLVFVAVQENQAVLMLFGTLATGFGMVLQYFFGSSAGSAQKTQLMASQSVKPPM